MTQGDSAQVGLFGKIPSLGDFFHRNLGRPEVALIDEWMQSGLLAARAQSDAWVQPYVVSPVWQFVIPGGHWSHTASCGTVMPSVDRVGRYFPLLAIEPICGVRIERVQQARLSRNASAMPKVLKSPVDPEAIVTLLSEGLVNEPIQALPLLSHFNPLGDRSLWWAERVGDNEFREIRHRGPPDADLFLRLFGL